jgi:putative nucleotidyltransferase with HDIG domain
MGTEAAIFIICLKTHHDATAEHSLRVARCSILLAKEMKLSEEKMRLLYYGCLLHDIGKIGVPVTVLAKQARLDTEERAIVQAHTWKGASMVHGFFPAEVTRTVNEHHENFDGSGYPSGLKGMDISPLARICAVVDAFDAITYDRDYRVRASYATALHELVEWSGRQFDPYVVEAFKRVPRDRWLVAAKQTYEELIAA